jgi:hypothetical protein
MAAEAVTSPTAPAPWTDLLRTRGRGLRGVAVELALVGIAVLVNLLVRWYTLDALDAAVAHARDVLSLERTLGLDWERPVQDGALAVPWLSDLSAWFYVWVYLPVLAAALVGLYAMRPTAYARLRNALLASGAIGMLCYAFYPTAPPRLSGLGYADTVATGGFGAEARPVGVANELAAIPSFHIAWLVVIAVVVYGATSSWLVRALCLAVPLLMSYAVVATGNHWVLDIPAGAVLGLVGLLLAERLARAVDQASVATAV